MRTVGRIRRFYGANPLHLLVLLGCFALTGYVLLRLLENPSLPGMLVWFGAAVVSHDLLLFPLYALADRGLAGITRVLRRGRRTPPAVPAVNYIRLPILGSGLLLLMFLPGIVQQGAGTYRAATGQTQEPFLGNWLLITATLFVLSAMLYAARLGVRTAQQRRRRREGRRAREIMNNP